MNLRNFIIARLEGVRNLAGRLINKLDKHSGPHVLVPKRYSDFKSWAERYPHRIRSKAVWPNKRTAEKQIKEHFFELHAYHAVPYCLKGCELTDKTLQFVMSDRMNRKRTK